MRKSITDLFKFSVNKIVFLITAISVIWILSYKFYWIRIEEFFPYAFEIGELTYILTNAIVSSGIFYYFVVYIDARRNKKLLHPVLKRMFHEFGHAEGLLRMIINTGIEGEKEMGGSFSLRYSPEDLMHLSHKIKLLDKPPYMINLPKFNNYYDLFEYFFQLNKNTLNEMHTFLPYLSAEALVKLDNLRYNEFEICIARFKSLEDIKGKGNNLEVHDYTLDGINYPFVAYLKNLQDLCAMAEN